MRKGKTGVFIAVALLLCGCTDEDFVAPSFLNVEGIVVKINPEDPLSLNEGFYRSDIVGAYVVAHYPGAPAVDTVGLFRFPFTTPLLFDGKADYIDLYPAVEHSGISGTLPYYTFYNRIHLTADDSTTLHSGDTLRLGVDTTYYSPFTKKLFYASFDSGEGSVRFDSVVVNEYNATEACTGDGYGRVHVTSSDATVKFAISGDPFIVSDPTSLIYLELDTKSDIRLQVYMHSTYLDGGSEDVLPVMVINPTDHWQHMYINLGRTWAYFNRHATFKLSFAAMNTESAEGDIRIDNVKLITTNVVL